MKDVTVKKVKTQLSKIINNSWGEKQKKLMFNQ